MKFNSEQSGRSMVEMLGVLAIIGVLSVAGIAGYSKAMAKFKVNAVMDQMTMTAANIRTAYSSQPNYNGISASVIRNLGLAEKAMESGTSALKNTYGGAVTVEASGSGDKQFKLTFSGLPKSACATIGTADWGFGSGGLSGLIINGSVPVTAIGSLATVGGANACGAGDNNSIALVYN